MNDNERLLERLFTALKVGDAAAAADSYDADARYQDIAFDLRGKDRIGAMWRLVCSRHITVDFRDIRADSHQGTAHWETHYVFSKTNRPVYNVIDSAFRFRDGKILTHHDRSSRWRWAQQALGFPAAIPVGLFPPLLRWKASRQLKQFTAEHPGAGAPPPAQQG
jgi:ketosteroid isomerase-like protein